MGGKIQMDELILKLDMLVVAVPYTLMHALELGFK
jgi:hypothetical protein